MNMAEILEEKAKGVCKVEKYTIPEFYRLIYRTSDREYIRLMINGELMMSDTEMEYRTSAQFIRNACGDVFVCGLGLGMTTMQLLEDPSVTSITIIEKYQDVIDCVFPQIKKYDKDNKLQIICADCFMYEPIKKYDTIFIDIWAYINSDIYEEEMKPLKRKYRKYLSRFGKVANNIFVWAEFEAKHNMKLY